MLQETGRKGVSCIVSEAEGSVQGEPRLGVNDYFKYADAA
jgi:hypothetical protein